VTSALLLETLAQGLHELVPAHGLDLLLLFLGEILVDQLLQPLFRDVRLVERIEQALESLEGDAEHAIELVEIALVLHQRGARKVIEILDRLLGEIGVHRFDQREIFAQGDRNLRFAKIGKELQKHGATV
jgi:hypothetical protein